MENKKIEDMSVEEMLAELYRFFEDTNKRIVHMEVENAHTKAFVQGLYDQIESLKRQSQGDKVSTLKEDH